MNHDTKMKKLYKVVVILGIISVLTLLFRLWSLFFIALALFIGANVWRRILKKNAPKQEPQPITEQNIFQETDEKSGICEQISVAVKEHFPDAKWVWAQPDTLRKIANGEDVCIILNGAGGYRKAKVNLDAGKVTGITLPIPSAKPVSSEPPIRVEESRLETQPVVNYELVAFEWKDANILKLNERINDAIGRGEEELLLDAGELPESESWESICKELRREGLNEVECVETGIKIKITQ